MQMHKYAPKLSSFERWIGCMQLPIQKIKVNTHIHKYKKIQMHKHTNMQIRFWILFLKSKVEWVGCKSESEIQINTHTQIQKNLNA